MSIITIFQNWQTLQTDIGAIAQLYKHHLRICTTVPCLYTLLHIHHVHQLAFHESPDIFFEDFEQADYIAIFSPVYNNFFPAPLKAIIDRFQRYYSARFCRGANPPIEKKKSVGLVVASGANSRQNADYMSSTLKQCFTVLNGELKARYYIPNTDSNAYTFNITELDKFVHQMKK